MQVVIIVAYYFNLSEFNCIIFLLFAKFYFYNKVSTFKTFYLYFNFL